MNVLIKGSHPLEPSLQMYQYESDSLVDMGLVKSPYQKFIESKIEDMEEYQQGLCQGCYDDALCVVEMFQSRIEELEQQLTAALAVIERATSMSDGALYAEGCKP